MYNIMHKNRVVNVFVDLTMARNALVDHPEARIVYTRKAIDTYEAGHSTLNGESEDGKKKS